MDKGETKTNKFYVALAALILVLLIATFIFSGNQITQAIIEDIYLTEGWDDLGQRSYDERVFGLEKQASIKYGLEDNSAFLRITTIKTLFMMSIEDLLEKTEETISQSAFNQNITLNQTSKLKGSRILINGHKTFYVLYSGSIVLDNITDEIVIIGETWNCARSGTSIICIGYAKITDNINSNAYNYSSLAKILGDISGSFVPRFASSEFIKEDGLIFNVKCH